MCSKDRANFVQAVVIMIIAQIIVQAITTRAAMVFAWLARQPIKTPASPIFVPTMSSKLTPNYAPTAKQA